MKPIPSNYAAATEAGQSSAELLILPDGRILAHNITPAIAVLLSELNPNDESMLLRASAWPGAASAVSQSHPPSPPIVRSALLPRP